MKTMPTSGKEDQYSYKAFWHKNTVRICFNDSLKKRADRSCLILLNRFENRLTTTIHLVSSEVTFESNILLKPFSNESVAS